MNAGVSSSAVKSLLNGGNPLALSSTANNCSIGTIGIESCLAFGSSFAVREDSGQTIRLAMLSQTMASNRGSCRCVCGGYNGTAIAPAYKQPINTAIYGKPDG
ncbi:hypothetical protein D3C84_1055180 [compost metagenome]